MYRQGRETSSPGTFIYNIVLRYTYICTFAHYNIHDVSQTRVTGQVRVSSAVDTEFSAKFHTRKSQAFTELGHFCILSLDTFSYLSDPTQFPTSTGQHNINSDIRFTSMPRVGFDSTIRVRVTEDNTHLTARGISQQPTQTHRIQNMPTFRKP